MTSKTLGLIVVRVVFISGIQVFAQASVGQPPAPGPLPPAAGARSGAPAVISPEILADGRVTFRLSAPEATAVAVNGDWPEGRDIAMTKGGDGVWSVTVGPLKPELWGYTFSVNGVRILDPRNVNTKRDGQRIDNVLLVSGPESANYEVKAVPHGTVAKVWYESPTLNMTRRMYVYTPPAYATSTAKVPVLYLLHGGGGDEDAWTTLGRTPQIMDNLIAAGKVKPMIVVMTNGNANQAAAPGEAPAGPQSAAANTGARGSNLFPTSLVKDVIPFIEKNYRVLTDKDNRAIAGLSMGGGHTLTATHANPGMFGYIGVFSAGPRAGSGQALSDEFKEQLAALKPSVTLYYVGCGVEDTLAKSGAANLVGALKEWGFNYRFNETPGGHTWANWRIYLSEFSQRLFQPAKPASPSALSTEEIAPGVTRIYTRTVTGKTSVNMHVVAGTNQALLIDTGYPDDIAPEDVRTLTPLPLLVVNTHAHPDHSGCNEKFGKVYVHSADLEAAKRYSGKCELIGIEDRHVFDLGGKRLEVILTVGHTPGSICLLDAQDKLLFTGDSANSQVWMHISRVPLETYLKSMKHLADRENEYTKLLIGHGPVAPVSCLSDLITCAEEILDGKAQPPAQPGGVEALPASVEEHPTRWAAS